jgi:hypothetical protein
VGCGSVLDDRAHWRVTINRGAADGTLFKYSGQDEARILVKCWTCIKKQTIKFAWLSSEPLTSFVITTIIPSEYVMSQTGQSTPRSCLDRRWNRSYSDRYRSRVRRYQGRTICIRVVVRR